MENHVFIAVLLAALLHAGWNSILKFGLDLRSSVLGFSLVQASIAILMLPFAPLPHSAAWPWIIGAAALHIGYKLFLVQAYTHADLSQAYPLARGTAPLIVTLFSVVVLGLSFGTVELFSIFAISLGILLMAFRGGSHGRMRGKAIYYAIATAGFTASYTLVDGIGARVAGTASGFVFWMVIIDAIGMIAHALLTRSLATITDLISALKAGYVAGVMSFISFWIAVWAFTQAPIAMVAALRESSILFAILIAAFIHREQVSGWRWTAACVIAFGIMVMRF